MSAERIAVLVQSLDTLTPPAPDSELDAGDVAEAASRLFAARAPLVDELRTLIETHPHLLDVVPHHRATLARVSERDARWAAAMARSRHELGQRLQGYSRLRRYRRS